MHRLTKLRSRHLCALLSLAGCFLLLLAPGGLSAQTISGTIADSTGAVVPGARIEIGGGDRRPPVILLSDARGKFSSPDLKPGAYSVRVTREGFEPLTQKVDLQHPVEIQLTLAVAQARVSITVSGKGRAFANADPVYRELRGDGLGDTFRCDDVTLTWDVATFHFEKGTLTFLSPVNGSVTGAVFIGEGHFTLKPATSLEAGELSRRTGAAQVEEDFTESVFRFTGDAEAIVARGLGERTEPSSEAAAVLSHWREKMREGREVAFSLTEYLLQGKAMDNIDAELLAAAYNSAHPKFFNVYLRGRKHKDLRYFVRERVGALPQLFSPEEVTLINFDPEGMEDGVWYLAHLKSEYAGHTARSDEDRRLFAARHYKIETVIGKNGHLFSKATVGFEPLLAGERVLKFDLLPSLRVTRVTDEGGGDLYYVQEGRKQDGSFYVILPQAPPLGKELSVTIEYSGDKVLRDAGGGSFYVGALDCWYPNLNDFGDRALYDLTFKVPRSKRIVSVGKLESESVEEDLAVTRWITPQPVTVAGFNYGEYQRLDLPDEITRYRIQGYYLKDLPGGLDRVEALRSMTPRGMTQYVLEQTRAQLQLCSLYFGKMPYDEIHITEQPSFFFGQSWPNLIYLPISAYTDSTQRFLLFGQNSTWLSAYIQEVVPHEVAGQWWGHAVSWASYHDQWLAEGFSEFSTGLFLQQAADGNRRQDYLDFWERWRKFILDKNNFGIAPNDAGPLWMGIRLSAPRTLNAYQSVMYGKGAYVLQMLRSLMYNPQDRNPDAAFMAMMHDFVGSHRDRPATTESFKEVAERHITKPMDMQGNGRLDWFFDEWVYGTQVPRYRFEYQTASAEKGKTTLHLSVTQSDVDERFVMLVPVFADYGKGMQRLGQVAVAGNSARTVDMVLPQKPKKVALNAYKDVLERY
jgi:hypothetical protein